MCSTRHVYILEQERRIYSVSKEINMRNNNCRTNSKKYDSCTINNLIKPCQFTSKINLQKMKLPQCSLYRIIVISVMLLPVFMPYYTEALNFTKPPTMIKQPAHEQLFQVALGDEIIHPFQLECEAQAVPEPTFTWYKNGEKFEYEVYDKRIHQEPKSGTLVFSKPEDVDEGLYQCHAKNPHGVSVSNSVYLRKSELSSFPEEQTREFYVEEGPPYSIGCNPPSGYPKPNIFWMMMSNTGAPISINNTRLTVDPEGNLHFANVIKSDQLENSVYVCSVYSPHRSEYKIGRKTKLFVQPNTSGSPGNHPPHIQYLSPPKIQALRGSKLVMHCIYGGLPVPDVIWRKKMGNLEGNKFSYLDYGKTLVVSRVDKSDEGTYECMASNGHGTQLSHAITVSVASAPYWIRAPNNTDAAPEESVSFECLAEGDPKPVLKWLYNGVPLDTQKRPHMRLDGNTLSFDSLRKEDMGVYQCNATNIHGYAFRDFYLNVLHLHPIVVEPPEKIARAVQSSTVKLRCSVFGAPKPKIIWKRDNSELSGGRFKILETGELQIEFVMPTDQGNYQCHATNKLGDITLEGELHVKQKTKIIQQPDNIEIPASKLALFRCNAEADPSLQLEVNWLFNGKSIDFEADPRMIQSRDNSLTISKTKELDSGTYTCLAKTSLDQVNASASLKVQDVPNPPRIYKLQCEKTTATIHWSPTGDRRAPILGYDVQQNTNDNPETWSTIYTNVPESDPRFTVELQPWLNFTFRIIARNKIGTSLPSEPSKICPTEPAIPSTNPADVKGIGTTPNNLVISWTIMERKHHNAPGFHYRVYYKRADIPDAQWNQQVLNDWKESRVVIQNQPTYVPYKIKVEAHNSMGQSNMQPEEIEGFSGQHIPTQEPKNFRMLLLISPTKAELGWDPVPPESLRGRFKGYRLQAWVDGDEYNKQEFIVGNTTTTIQAEILQPFANNTVQVRAINDLYNGPPSKTIIIPTPESVPDAVPLFTATQMGSTAFYLTWKRPEKINGRLTGYEIYHEEVVGTDVKEKVKRHPSIDNPDDTKAKLAGLKPKTKYRITIVAKTQKGEGAPYYIEAKTDTHEEIVPEAPSFLLSKSTEQNGLFSIRVTWLPDYRSGKPGSAFYVQYRRYQEHMWLSTLEEQNNDTLELKDLDINTTYEVKVVSIDGRYQTPSQPVVIAYNSMPSPLMENHSWIIGLLGALFALVCVFFLVCFVKENRGGKYFVHEKEIALGQDPDDFKDGFDEYKSSASRPLRQDEQSLNSLDASEADSLTDYEGDKSKFEEDGSFIGQYGVKKRSDLPTIQNQRVATFV